MQLLLLAVLGCAAEGDRADWVRETLVRADMPYWSRPDRLADKYAAMATNRYDYFRGSGPVFWADVSRPGPRRGTAFLTDPAATAILVVGDAHPENFATNLPEGATEAPDDLRLEWVDLDAASFAPWTSDVRRAALGLLVLVEPLSPDATTAAVQAFAEGYVDGLAGDPHVEGTIVAELRAGAAIDGVLDRRLADWTVDGRFRAEGLVDGIGFLPLNDVEQVEFDAIVAQLELPDGARVLDGARRYGVGVSSRPALRYAALWDRGADGPADDDVLSAREVVDPPPIAGRPLAPFDGEGDRVVAAARRVWSDPAADPRVQSVRVGARSFKIQSSGSFFENLDHTAIGDRFDADDLDDTDLIELAADLGYYLGGAHARSGTADGGDSQAIITADLGGRTGVLADELIAHSQADLVVLAEDWDRFGDAVAADPLLWSEDLAPGVGR